jgi:hypothetical protein
MASTRGMRCSWSRRRCRAPSRGSIAGCGCWVKVLPTALLLLLFPTGRPLSPRWRVLGWLDAVGIALVAIASALSPSVRPNLPEIANPLGWEGARALPDAVLAISPLVLLGGVLGGSVRSWHASGGRTAISARHSSGSRMPRRS